MRGALLSGSDLCYEERMKTWKRVLIGAMVLGSAVGCRRLIGGSPTAKTEDEKTLYTLGMLLGRNLGTFNLTADELELVKAGLSDMVMKRPHQVDLEKYGPKVDTLARTRAQAHVAVEKAQAKAFLDNAARESGAVQTPSGLVFRSTSPGTGASPTPTSPSSVRISTMSPDADVRMPPVHFNGSRKGTRTAVVCTLVIRKRLCRLGSGQAIVNHLAIVNNTHAPPAPPP